jgi:hypothetical protein
MTAMKLSMPRTTRAQAFVVEGIALLALSAVSRSALPRHEGYQPGFCDLQNLLDSGSGGALVI